MSGLRGGNKKGLQVARRGSQCSLFLSFLEACSAVSSSRGHVFSKALPTRSFPRGLLSFFLLVPAAQRFVLGDGDGSELVKW